MTFKTHYFDNTGEAYDKTQTGYYRYACGVKIAGSDWDQEIYTEVADGDLVVVPKEGVYGFLNEAWPIAYVPDFKVWLEAHVDDNERHPYSGEFQVLKDAEAFLKDNPKYVEVYEAAMHLYNLHHATHKARYRGKEEPVA